MKIAFVGAQGVGKTTLMKELERRGDSFWQQHKFLYEMVRSLTKHGFKINEGGNDLSQRVIMLELFAAAHLNDNHVADRCVLDSLAYTCWLYERGLVSADTYAFAVNAVNRCLPLYDLIFYIKPEFDLVDDGIRSINKQYQTEIDGWFDTLVKSPGCSYVLLTGDVESRLDQIDFAITQRQLEDLYVNP